MIKHYLKTAFRNIGKYRFQNIVAILGVAIGLVCFTICCYVPRFYNMNNIYPDSERMYAIYGDGETLPEDVKQMLLKQFPAEIENAVFMNHNMPSMVQLNLGNKKLDYDMTLVEGDTSIIPFFSLELLKGNYETIKNTNNSIVLFENYVKKIGNIDSLFGKEIIYKGDSFYLNGILKKPHPASVFSGLNLSGFVFRQEEYQPDEFYWDIIPICLKLRKGVNPTEFQKKLKQLNINLPIERSNIWDQKEVRKQVFIIVMTGFLILLIGALNYFSLMMVQFYNRIGEHSIRKAHGSGMFSLFKLILTEFLIIWSIIALISFLILIFFAPYLNIFESIILNFDLNLLQTQLIEYILWGIIGITLICVFLTFSIEKLRVKTSLIGVINKGRKMSVRNIILFIQMIVFAGFFSSALLIHRQVSSMYSGFYPSLSEKEKDKMIVLRCEKPQLDDQKETLLNLIKSSPTVKEATYTYSRIFQFTPFTHKVDLESPGLENATIGTYAVSPDFPSFFNLKLISGQFFKDESNPEYIVVNEMFAALYPDKNPIGKSFTFIDTRHTIIGVVENVETGKNKDLPLFYLPVDGWKKFGYSIYVKPIEGKEKEARKHVEQCVRKFVPETIDFKIETLSEYIKAGHYFKEDIMLQKIISLFSAISLVICMLSIYSSITLNAERRRKEIAIRKINGAGAWQVICLISKTYVYLLTAACAVAFPIVFYFLNQWLEKFPERISLNWIFFLLVYLGILILVIATTIFKVLKVANENPSEVVKSE